MIALDSGDKIRGDASAATVVDYTIHGLDANAIKQLADGQLAATIGDLYTADSADVVSSIILVNTDTVARTVNLYLTPSTGTARRLIPKNCSLGIGYSLHFDGASVKVYDASGNLLTTATTTAHKTSHQDAGSDEISVVGLSGLLADDQHVLDAEVTAVAIPLTQKAAASGVASLNASSLVVQNPATSYIPLAQKAAASGVASLDASSKVVQDPATAFGKLTVAETVVFNSTSPTSWTDLNLSAVVGANLALVVLKFTPGAGGDKKVAVRKNGDTDNYYGADTTLAQGCSLAYPGGTFTIVLLVPTDSSGIIEWITGSASTVILSIIAFIK